MLRSILRDLRFALRLLRKNPVLTAVAIFTMAVGIAANTVIFSVVHAIVIRPLPYADADRLVEVSTALPKGHVERLPLSGPEYLDLKRGARSLEDLAGWADGLASFNGGASPVAVTAAYGTDNLLSLLGVAPHLGRLLDARDAKGDLATTIVLGHQVWQQTFGGDPTIVGRTIVFDGSPVTVVGIMPPSFSFPDGRTQAWVPLPAKESKEWPRAAHFLHVVGRLKSDKTLEDLRADIEAAREAWRTEVVGGGVGNALERHTVGFEEHPLVIKPLKEELLGAVRPTLLLLQGAVAFVLLIACTNVSSLLLSLAEARWPEIAVRTALGATPGRLVRQFMTESLFLGLVGGAFGLLLAQWGLDVVLALLPPGAPRSVPIELDGTVLAVTVLTSIGAGLAFGLTPALQVLRENLSQPAGAAGHRATTSWARARARRALVVAEVAMAVVLLAGAGLTVRSLVRLQNIDPGFDPQNLVTFELEAPEPRYPTTEDFVVLYERVRTRISALPGVVSASWGRDAPLQRRLWVMPLDEKFEGSTVQQGGFVDYMQLVEPGYFATMGIRLREGRLFESQDTESSGPVAVINETMAARFWPTRSAIGESFRPATTKPDPQTIRVIGVVADVKQAGLDAPTGAEYYQTVAQLPGYLLRSHRIHPRMTFFVRVTGDPAQYFASIQRQVQALDPQLPVVHLGSSDHLMWEAVARPRFLTTLFVALALLALVMATVGIYGVTTHSVHQRTQELGIRLALGAPPRRVLQLVLRQGLALSAAGILLGVAGAVTLVTTMRRAFASVLFDGTTLDTATVAPLAAIIALISAAACYIPALRATRIPPTTAMRG